jgi:hypothetical protein
MPCDPFSQFVYATRGHTPGSNSPGRLRPIRDISPDIAGHLRKNRHERAGQHAILTPHPDGCAFDSISQYTIGLNCYTHRDPFSIVISNHYPHPYDFTNPYSLSDRYRHALTDDRCPS